MPPFRAEHLGSLLRSQELIAARDDKTASGEVEARSLEDKEIRDIVDTQLSIGLHSITDGEYRRNLFWGTFFDQLQGFSEVPFDEGILRTYMPNVSALLSSGYVPGGSMICTSKIKHVGSAHIDEFNFLKNYFTEKNLPLDNIKLTIPSPNWYHLRYKEGKAYAHGVYASDAEYFEDLAKAYQVELQLLYDAGLRNVQIDDPNLSYFCSTKMLDGWAQDPTNTTSPEKLFEDYIDFYNQCFSKVPADMHIGMHICRGNFVQSNWVAEGGYDRIAMTLFQKLNINTFYLEYDTPNSGGFKPLRDLPKDKNLILGVVSTKFPQLEDITEMKEKVFAAAKYVAEGNNQTPDEALKRLGVSPQCGFASHSREDRLSREDMVNKLRLVRKLADEIWPGEL